MNNIQTPDPVNTTVPITPLPDGTIFMFGYDAKLVTSLHQAPKPEPDIYFRLRGELLGYVVRVLKPSTDPIWVKNLSATVDYCTVYSITLEDKPLYIYVWAIPMGGAA